MHIEIKTGCLLCSTKVDVKKVETRGKKEIREFEVTEEWPHIGHVTYTAKSTADNELQRMTTNYAPMYGLLEGND